jgi:thioredoxin 1
MAANPTLAKALGGDSSPVEEEMMSDAIVQRGDADFEQEVLKSDLPVLVDFWAPWCGPCLMIAPLLEEIAKANQGKLKVVKINVDENGKTPVTYGVMSIPTLMVFKGGELKDRLVGFRSKNDIIDLFTKYV